ncbi:MAG: type 1 glutamine amidotransferase [Boseongicola sp.]|nr:MAG: type 1 glutamine amidotransferase [Boseongicola sp.]
MRIGILTCGHFVKADGVPHRDYDQLYSDMLAGHGLTFENWDVVDMDFPGSIHDAEGWLLSGSRHGAYEELPFIPKLEEFVRSAYAAKVPMVGVCFGHQVMAQALGGTVEKFKGGWSAGLETYDFDDGPMRLNAWHQDQVIKAPPKATTIASTDFCEHAAFVYEGPAFSVQPHPEFEDGELVTLLDIRAPGVVPDPLIADAKGHIGHGNDNAAMAKRIADFFKEAKDDGLAKEHT